MSIKVVAITHPGTSETRLQNLKQANIHPLNLEIYNGVGINAKEFQYFYNVPCDDPSVKCLLYNTVQVLYNFLQSTDEFLLVVEDDVIFVNDFYTRLQKCISIWKLVQPSYILRIGLLPLVNAFGEWPIKDAQCIPVDNYSSLYYNIKQRVVGAQGIVYSKAGARIFLETYTGSFLPKSIRYSTIIEHVGRSKVPFAYGIDRWDYYGHQKVPATDHLLNLEILHQALIINPLVIESEEGQTSSSCASIPSQQIWAPLIEQGFTFK